MGRHVVVPDIMMHELPVPNPFARLDIQADERGSEQIGAGTMSAISIVGRVLYIEIHVPKFLVGGKRSPNAGVAGVIRRPIQPCVVTELAFAGNRMEHPQLLTGMNVEGHDVALDVVIGRGARRQSRSHDDHVMRNHGRRTVADLSDQVAFVIQVQPFKKIDRSEKAVRRLITFADAKK